MKNKLYIIIFAIFSLGYGIIFADGSNGQGLSPFFGGVWGGTPSTNKDLTPNWSKIVAKDKPNTLGASHNLKLGDNTSTYAPSEEEDFLRRLSNDLNNLNSEYANKLEDIASKIAQLRMNDLQVFLKYFDLKTMLEGQK